MKKLFYILIILLILFVTSCKNNKSNLSVKNINVSFLGGSNYKVKPNKGGFEILIIETDFNKSNLRIANELNDYSPIKKPIIITINKKNNIVNLCNEAGQEFALGVIDTTENNCNYNCKINFFTTDIVTLKSSLGFFPYLHGLSPLGGLSLFMRYHYYTLKIKKQNGTVLIIQWKYSVHKYIPFGKKSKVWSGDYSVDKGGGLTKLKIK